jgi:hypothetical protein
MDSRVDPPSPLWGQNTPRFRSYGTCNRIRNEHDFERGEVIQKERRQETIFTKRERVLLVKRINVAFGVLVDDTVGDDDRSALVCGTDTVERETSRKTRY